MPSERLIDDPADNDKFTISFDSKALKTFHARSH